MLVCRAGALWAGRPLRVPLGVADAAGAGLAQGGGGFVQQPRHGFLQGAKSAEDGQACGSRQPGHGPPSALGAGLGQPEHGPLLATRTRTAFRTWGRGLLAISAGVALERGGGLQRLRHGFTCAVGGGVGVVGPGVGGRGCCGQTGHGPKSDPGMGSGQPRQRPLLALSTGIIHWGCGAFRQHRRVSFRMDGTEHTAYGLCVVPDQALGSSSGVPSLAGRWGRSS